MTLAVTDRFSSSRSFRRLLPPDDGWVRAGGHEHGQHHDRPSSAFTSSLRSGTEGWYPRQEEADAQVRVHVRALQEGL